MRDNEETRGEARLRRRTAREVRPGLFQGVVPFTLPCRNDACLKTRVDRLRQRRLDRRAALRLTDGSLPRAAVAEMNRDADTYTWQLKHNKKSMIRGETTKGWSNGSVMDDH